MVMAILGGAWYLVERGQELGQDSDQLANITFWTVIAGVVGARLVFVLANDPSWIWTDPVQALKIWDGGLAYDGAVGATSLKNRLIIPPTVVAAAAIRWRRARSTKPSASMRTRFSRTG